MTPSPHLRLPTCGEYSSTLRRPTRYKLGLSAGNAKQTFPASLAPADIGEPITSASMTAASHNSSDGLPSPDVSPTDLIASPVTTNTLPALATRLTRRDILAIATRLSKAGKLPGFAPESHGSLFAADAHAWPIDRVLVVSATENRDGDVMLGFTLKPRMKTAFFLMLVCLVAVWPGVWIVHSMLGIYFDWYTWPLWATCLWYIPLTAGPLPWVGWAMLRKSRKEAHESAMATINLLREHVGADASLVRVAEQDAAPTGTSSRASEQAHA